MRKTFLLLVVAFVWILGAGGALAQDPDMVVRLESTNFPGLFVRHSNFEAILTRVETRLDELDSAFHQRSALDRGPGVSFESVNFPGRYLRHRDFRLVLEPNDGTAQFAADASFLTWPGPAGATGFEASNFRNHFIHHQNFALFVHRSDDSQQFRDDSGFQVREVKGLVYGSDDKARRCTVRSETQVYQSPDEQGQVLGVLAEGEVVGSTRREWDWYLVHIPGPDGWVPGSSIGCE